jgi:DNA-directed RNA polymerase subunit RPC12/RpoP
LGRISHNCGRVLNAPEDIFRQCLLIENGDIHSVSALRVQVLRKSGYQRGVVPCRKCKALIPVQNFSALPDEFSVRCPSCGDRAFYAKRAVAIQDLPERRKKPRR